VSSRSEKLDNQTCSGPALNKSGSRVYHALAEWMVIISVLASYVDPQFSKCVLRELNPQVYYS